MAKEIKKEELKKEETKELENENLEEQETNEEENKDLPAEVPEKKGFHPIKFVTGKAKEFGENHPKVVSGLKTAGKVGAGIGIGAVGTIAVLASIAKGQADNESNDIDNSELENDDIVDSTATEVEETTESEE